jgi:hypothetical protein
MGSRVLCSGVQAFGRSGVGNPDASGALSLSVLNPRTPETLNTPPPIWRGSGDEVVFIAGGAPGPIAAVPRQGDTPPPSRPPGAREVSSLPCIWVRSDSSGERLVALVMARERAEKLPSGQIVLIDARSGEAVPLVSGCSAGARPCFSPDGQFVVYAGSDDREFTQVCQVYLQDG